MKRLGQLTEDYLSLVVMLALLAVLIKPLITN